MRKPHTELKNTHKNEDIWVIGAGASMNYIDPSFFDGKIVIGVNRVCRFFRCDYIVSKDGRGFNELLENLGGARLVLSRWESGNPKSVEPPSLEKIFPGENVVDYDHYFFTHPRKPNEQPLLDCVGTEDIVVSYSSITSAIHLAAYMGAKNVILCGHDCGMIDGQVTIKDYYKNIKPVQGSIRHYHHWLKTQIEKHTINLKAKLKEVYGTNVVSINPFINLGLEGHKYDRQGIPVQQDPGTKVKGVKIAKKKNHLPIESPAKGDMSELIASKDKAKETLKISKWVAANMHGKDDPNFKRIHHFDHHVALYIKDYIMKESCRSYCEIGTHFGHSLCSMLQSKYESTFISCDLFQKGPIAADCHVKVEPIANKNADKFNKNNYKYEIIKGDSQSEYVKELIKHFCPNGIDLLFIDGDHRYGPVMKDFENYFPLVNPGGYVVFDDYLPLTHEGNKRGAPIAIDKIVASHNEELELAGLAKGIDDNNSVFIIKKA